MLLFLDTISPIPEICIIEDNKVVINKKILSNENEKLSDFIFEVFIELNKNLNLSKNLRKIAITTGPGSYTSLRVGAAFISGLGISKDLLISTISAGDIIKFKSKINKIEEIGIFIYSANNQKFLCTMNKNEKINYLKLENDQLILPKNIKNLFFNFVELKTNILHVKQNKFSFINEFLENKKSINFVKNKIIKPIYISNNRILN